MNYSISYWIYSTSQVHSNCSTVLGGDYVTFYVVHVISIILLSLSFLSCCAVFYSISQDFKNRLSSLCELSSRFPFFIAVTDSIWCICHMSDHMYFLWFKTCPEKWVINIFGSMMTFGIGYQQFMHAGLAMDMYLKICKNYTMTLGVGEWRIHAFTVICCSAIAGVSIYTDAYGCSGFWIMNNLQTQSGNILAASCSLLGSFLCFLSSTSYISIKRMVNRRRDQMNSIRRTRVHNGYHHTAAQCLTTYIAISFVLYCPLSVGYLLFLLETSYFQVIETTTILIIIFSANSLGSANAFAYFYNRRVRSRRRTVGRVKGVRYLEKATSCGQWVYNENSKRLSVNTMSSAIDGCGNRIESGLISNTTSSRSRS